jgi:hypothetical protein
MKLAIMDMPDEAPELALWLERQLTGFELSKLIAELSTIRGAGNGSLSFQDMLGPYLESILQTGLSTLPPEKVQQLISNPTLLLELQERLLEVGTPYWDRVINSQVPAPETSQKRARLLAALEKTERDNWVMRFSQKKVGILITVTAAAAAVVGFLAIRTWLPGTNRDVPSWGWGRPGALAGQTQPKSYLGHVADEANEWFSQRPTDRASLIRRIEEMHQGCSALLAAKHSPLSEKDKEWLLERCRAWDAKFVEQLGKLKSGGDFEAIRAEADDTVRKLERAIRQRVAEA